MPRSGSGSSSARSSSASTIASIAIGSWRALSPRGVGVRVRPAGAVGEQVAVLAASSRQTIARSASSFAGEGSQPGAQVVAEPEVRAHGLGLALALLVAALALVGRGLAQVGGVESGAGEVGRVGRAVSSACSPIAWRTASSMKTGSTTQIPAAKSGPRSCT